MPEGSSPGSSKEDVRKPIRASFSLASTLNIVQKKKDQQIEANKEKARIKRRRRRQNQKISKAKARASEASKTEISCSKRKADDSDAGDSKTIDETEHGNSDPVVKLASLKFLPRALLVKKAKKDDNANCGLAENSPIVE